MVISPAELPSNPDVVTLYPDVEANTVSMLLQVPQYVVITAGEILFSITGLAFAYAEVRSFVRESFGL